jgi:serine/threonine-protein kinase
MIAPLCLATACAADAPGGGATGSGSGKAGPYFERGMFFNRDVSDEPKAPNSDELIDAVRRAGGWGNQNHLKIDFSMDVLRADESTPRMFTPSDTFEVPDCDHMPVPVPAVGNVEGESGYKCSSGGDCHLIILDHNSAKLYEMWKANISTTFSGGCLAVWDLEHAYDDKLRGDQCTSADGAGLPIAPLLFTADEVASGSIDHAIRFILPNDRITQGFVRPATHAAYTSGELGLPYYGVHLRLRADYPIETLTTTGAQVVARAMQKYGMYHADGGEDTLTAHSDKYTTAKWDGLLGSNDLYPLSIEDFEVIDHGAMFPITNDCNR